MNKVYNFPVCHMFECINQLQSSKTSSILLRLEERSDPGPGFQALCPPPGFTLETLACWSLRSRRACWDDRSVTPCAAWLPSPSIPSSLSPSLSREPTRSTWSTSTWDTSAPDESRTRPRICSVSSPPRCSSVPSASRCKLSARSHHVGPPQPHFLWGGEDETSGGVGRRRWEMLGGEQTRGFGFSCHTQELPNNF